MKTNQPLPPQTPPEASKDAGAGCISRLVVPALDVWDSLLIRACKSNNTSMYRLRRIWAMRCGLRQSQVWDTHLADRLMILVEHFQLKTLSEFAWALNPTELWKVVGVVKGMEPRDDNSRPIKHAHRMIAVAASALCSAEVARLPGYRSPTRFSRLRHNVELVRPLPAWAEDELGVKV